MSESMSSESTSETTVYRARAIATLAMAGYGRETDIEGVAKDADGEPTGELQEFAAMFPLMRRLGIDFRSTGAHPESTDAFGATARLVGVTTATDLAAELTDRDVEAQRSATARADFPLRIVPMLRHTGETPEAFAARGAGAGHRLGRPGVPVVSALPPLPVTVIAGYLGPGYLGAGKTTLVNHLLRHAGGRRIMVLVNDFGDIAIDADLLESAEEDTLTLANGCVCCTLRTDLMYALADALDRRPRPDCLVIEASGVARPRKIAEAARAEPEMRYCGIVTLVDAATVAATVADPRIGTQAADQIAVADLAVLTKTDIAPDAAARAAIGRLSAAPVIVAPRGAVNPDLVLERPAGAPPPGRSEPDHHGYDHGHDHGQTYRSWSYSGPARVARAGLERLLAAAPPGLYRLKGRVMTPDGRWAQVDLVGRTQGIELIPPPEATEIVAIGVAPDFDPAALERLWMEISSD